ncbi:acetyl-CoA synthetase [Pseudorhodobacter antarcticus]|uniref:Acetyl-CoA synthetase n=1 Tax=Pseudorhodobacter antarcticus TaxID=1077947 RepID=A0A1H8GEM7_9RHOB|nr:AMP-binding protein [Pseudorhodobacter antarcticus]SEN41758.1 acetyl-CoA synthetase [Pseudorhodobacter antarcticus]
MIPLSGDWAAKRAAFAWDWPADFNIAQGCCDDWARAEPDRVALIEVDAQGARDWTYGALKDASDRLASAFLRAGVRRGDRVAVLLAQSAAVPIVHFAAMKLGAVALPLFTLFGTDALLYRLADSGAAVVVTDGESLSKILKIAPELPDLTSIFCTDATPDAANLWASIAAYAPLAEPVITSAEDAAVMIYTSGTTGPPKGVLHAHRFLFGHLPSMELTHGGFPQPGDKGWTPADWAWIGGLMDMAMPCLYYGVPLVAHRMRKFDAAAAYALIADHGIRNVFMPPTALKLMRGAAVPDSVRLRSISSGGEALGAEMLVWGQATLGAPINELYGQTECNLCVSQVAGMMAVKPGSMGQALPGFDVVVMDDAGTPCPPGVMGEICVAKGAASMFLRYWNQPEKTAAKFRGDWLRTGDLGVADSDGYLTFAARDDDVITSAGYRIGPSEIENCLMGDSDVVMAACVGVPDALRTEIVRAFVVLRSGAVPDAQRLIDRVKTRVSPHVAPRDVVFVDTLPMTATGKVMRRELRDLAV